MSSAAAMTWAHSITRALLDWFVKNARVLPWRSTHDPYAVWISEIMLQQTQVKTVIPYWERWMRELPDIACLANAREEKVLKLWEGLGYYTRARNLQKAARQILAHHGGQFPRQYDDVLNLPGIGRYTAGAICSIAYNQAKPILDGNVIRVLCRLQGIRESPTDPAIQKRLWQLAEDLVQVAAEFTRLSTLRNQCHSFLNQSLMELGALICTPRNPFCAECPVAPTCQARVQNLTDSIPAPKPRPQTRVRHFVAVVLVTSGRLWVRQRPAGEINAGFWEFPNFEINPQQQITPALIQAQLGQAVTHLKSFMTIKHSITNNRITVQVFTARIKPPYQPPEYNANPVVWIDRKATKTLAFTAAHRKIIQKFLVGESD